MRRLRRTTNCAPTRRALRTTTRSAWTATERTGIGCAQPIQLTPAVSHGAPGFRLLPEIIAVGSDAIVLHLFRMHLKFDKATSILTASVSHEEQICLNDANLPIDGPSAVLGKELLLQIYTERTRILREWLKPVEVRVVLENAIAQPRPTGDSK